jgi:lipid A 3-O-deacylase
MVIYSNTSKRLSAVIIFLLLLGSIGAASAQEGIADPIPTRYGLAGIWGKTIDPVTNIHFIQVSGFIMWDYDRIWRHWAPDPLRFKLEAAAGITTTPENRAMASIGMMALYYLDFFRAFRLRPYIEGGIGLIYTDFQLEEKGSQPERQGSRINFNPQIGIGTEFGTDSQAPFFATVRLSHISNGDLHSENRGVNSIVLMIGRFF